MSAALGLSIVSLMVSLFLGVFIFRFVRPQLQRTTDRSLLNHVDVNRIYGLLVNLDGTGVDKPAE